MKFVAGLTDRLAQLVVFGRLAPEPGSEPYELPEEARFVALPDYPSLTALLALGRSVRRARAAFAEELPRLDAVWLFGPHPLSLAFARLARRRGTPVFLGIRQDFPRYVAGRLPGRAWLPVLPAAHLLEAAFRRLGRTAPTVAVGEALGLAYAGGAPVLTTGFSLIRTADLVPLDQALSRSWEGDLRLLWVGRVDPEKNPLLLPDVLARLRARDPRWRLTMLGTGSLVGEVERRAAEVGVADTLKLAGYVANGPDLFARYRASHALVNVSDTEGLPQVVFEAHAAGIPVVATDVGGTRAGLGDGASGLLVPPRDADAVALALSRVAGDEPLRRRLITAGLEEAARETLDAQLDRIVAFFHENLSRRRG